MPSSSSSNLQLKTALANRHVNNVLTHRRDAIEISSRKRSLILLTKQKISFTLPLTHLKFVTIPQMVFKRDTIFFKIRSKIVGSGQGIFILALLTSQLSVPQFQPFSACLL